MSQDKLAELMGTSKTTISNVENRKTPYYQDFLELAAEVMQPFTTERLDAATFISRPPPRKDQRRQTADLDSLESFIETATAKQKRQIMAIAKTILNPEE